MSSLDEAYNNIVENPSQVKKERTLDSLIKEREKFIKPFTQKQNEAIGNVSENFSSLFKN